ncbi:hypothetical protein [Thioclava sp. GXIMD4216]|uniref:Uncharacterized protein n=1 Tax=Thioclava litoralis TaxID=3076557 RepID=A0ABZ1E184_9RHOB|nr:hypothetical protein RPE78_12950 [Thioclava sp. FTW29]
MNTQQRPAQAALRQFLRVSSIKGCMAHAATVTLPSGWWVLPSAGLGLASYLLVALAIWSAH